MGWQAAAMQRCLSLALAVSLFSLSVIAPHVHIPGESPASTFPANGPSYRSTDSDGDGRGEPDDQVGRPQSSTLLVCQPARRTAGLLLHRKLTGALVCVHASGRAWCS